MKRCSDMSAEFIYYFQKKGLRAENKSFDEWKCTTSTFQLISTKTELLCDFFTENLTLLLLVTRSAGGNINLTSNRQSGKRYFYKDFKSIQ